MSIQAVAWALEQDLPARPKLVLVSIANHANHTDGYCWLKAETIASEAACTPRSVYRFIGGLVRNGYLRKAQKKAADGRQRANDYWILFRREEKKWDWGAEIDDAEIEKQAIDEMAEDATDNEVIAVADDNTTSSDVASLSHDRISSGFTGENSDPELGGKPAVSRGPADSRVSRNESLNHPSLNQKQESARAGARAAISAAQLRHYKPPPEQPLAADTQHKTNPVFAYEGSRAYEAWAKVKAKESGIRHWNLTTRALIDGKWRSGWYFPTLFPPSTADPPEESGGQEHTREFTGSN